MPQRRRGQQFALLRIHSREAQLEVFQGNPGFAPAAAPEKIADPTGCGDAYRGGLLFGLQRGLDWAVTGRIASLMGSLKITSRGGQNHHATGDQIAARYREAFGAKLW